MILFTELEAINRSVPSSLVCMRVSSRIRLPVAIMSISGPARSSLVSVRFEPSLFEVK